MYTFGRVTVSLECREVCVDGQPRYIGARAFEILELLVKAAGRLVSKDEIMAAVWPNTIVVENNIQVHISSLRKLFGGKHGWIRTESGRGYRLAPPADAAHAGRLPDVFEPVRGMRAGAAPRKCPLIGREQEAAELHALLEREAFVTLVGPGGVGKSHLALEVAAAWSAVRGIEMVRIDLAGWPGGATLESAVLDALGLPGGPTAGQADVVRTIGEQRVMLVFDNAEQHVGELADLCEAIADENAGAILVVTSREPLRVAGERVYRVGPLPVPPAGATDGEIVACGAVRMFLARARAMGTDMPSDVKTLDAIATVCRRLSGLPLALELGAARVALLGIQGLAADLDKSVLSLSGGLRTAHPRQQTLRATIEWSYRLLDDTERTVLCRLAVFPDAFPLDAACALAACDELGAARVLDCLVSLASKSLLVVHSVGLSKRYSLLGVVRAYALEKLAESGDAGRVHARCASFSGDEHVDARPPAPTPAASAQPLLAAVPWA
ncbi:winged helix-turn-helix domain-containing protein [Burkholderia cepacia]|uniref:winged helix-turn-helix domain-containing protein n=1 Tax=Burkholderia cepacia TaxID=292 RepID=UPI00249ED30D|nr:winged helix-turn-helix domain-containing protein [Burkholderia cepacia]WGY73556.1 winged helix-turn-helix domain-containing protein [Burkholderia cepacia]